MTFHKLSVPRSGSASVEATTAVDVYFVSLDRWIIARPVEFPEDLWVPNIRLGMLSRRFALA